jgi:hypothetical protein
MKKAEEIFNGETYPGLVQTMQGRDKNQSFIDGNLDYGFQENGKLKIQPGKSKGLTVILDSHSDFFAAGSLEEDTKGFLGTIHPTENFPMTTTGSFELRPGPAFWHLNYYYLKGISHTMKYFKIKFSLFTNFIFEN